MPLLNYTLMIMAFVAILCLVLPIWAAAVMVFFPRPKGRHVAYSLPVFALACGAWLWHLSSPEVVFERLFGFAPPADVTEMRSSQSRQGKTAALFMRFRASPETVRRVARARSLEQGGLESEAPLFPRGDDHPSWWRPTLRPGVVVHHSKSRGAHFRETQEEYVVHDPTTGVVHYLFFGRD